MASVGFKNSSISACGTAVAATSKRSAAWALPKASSAAKAKAKSLKYGPCRVIPASKFDKFIGREFWVVKKNTALTYEIARKENEWHDDDWYEGINDD